MEPLLKNDRLIRAGSPCPYVGICPSASTCNRPLNMDVDFSCVTARSYYRSQNTGLSRAQITSIEGDEPRPLKVSTKADEVLALLNVDVPDSEKRPDEEKQRNARRHTPKNKQPK